MATEAEKKAADAALIAANAKALDNAFASIEIKRQLREVAPEKWDCTDAQAADFAELHLDQFGLVKGMVIHLATNLPIDRPEVRDALANEFPHLVPQPIKAPLADAAFLENNLKARGEMVRTLGTVATLEIARKYGHADLGSRAKGKRPANVDAPEKEAPKLGAAGEHANNPFSRQGWNISKQGALLRAVGAEKCAAIAASVNSRIGATKATQ